MKNILVIYTSIGLGHKKIAENIAAVLQSDSNNKVELLDLYDVESGGLKKYGEKLYYFFLKYSPWIWEFFYINKIFVVLTLPFRTFVAGFNSKKLARVLINKHYDVVVSTHANSSAIVSYLKSQGMYTGKFVIAFSDYHLHRYWLHDNADLYLANIDEQKQEMVSRGIAPKKIVVSGMTLRKEESVADKQKVRNKFNLHETDKVIAVLAGSRGFGMNSEIIDQLAKIDASIFVACGTNEETRTHLIQKYRNFSNIKVLGYVNTRELAAIANVVVTKPGGLTVAECLEQRVPILVSHFLPGQERLNIEYLKRHGLIMPLSTDYYNAVKHELVTGAFAAKLKENPDVKLIVRYGEGICEAIAKL